MATMAIRKSRHGSLLARFGAPAHSITALHWLALAENSPTSTIMIRLSHFKERRGAGFSFSYFAFGPQTASVDGNKKRSLDA